MAVLQCPCTLFTTQKRLDDHKAPDMQCGDLTQAQLKKDYFLSTVSERVDPSTLTKIHGLSRPPSMFAVSRVEGVKISRQECARMMFDEFRSLSHAFSILGPYRHLIGKMITHMQNSNGTPLTSVSLDSALKDHILRDTAEILDSRDISKKKFYFFRIWFYSSATRNLA